jgi:hypothetical protein
MTIITVIAPAIEEAATPAIKVLRSFTLGFGGPPYLPSALWDDDLQPRIAYDGGWNGFQFIARFISELPRFLPKSDYLVALESFHAHHLLLPGWEIVSGGDDVKRFAFLRG